MFQKALYSKSLKVGNMWLRVKGCPCTCIYQSTTKHPLFCQLLHRCIQMYYKNILNLVDFNILFTNIYNSNTKTYTVLQTSIHLSQVQTKYYNCITTPFCVSIKTYVVGSSYLSSCINPSLPCTV